MLTTAEEPREGVRMLNAKFGYVLNIRFSYIRFAFIFFFSLAGSICKGPTTDTTGWWETG